MSHPIRSARDAEQAALEYFVRLGHSDAHLTGRGADGGVDVEATELVVQVKAQAAPVGLKEVQRISGIAHHGAKTGALVALDRFTLQATAWADNDGIALFTFDLAGDVEPVNSAAMDLVSAAVGSEWPSPPRWRRALRDESVEFVDASGVVLLREDHAVGLDLVTGEESWRIPLSDEAVIEGLGCGGNLLVTRTYEGEESLFDVLTGIRVTAQGPSSAVWTLRLHTGSLCHVEGDALILAPAGEHRIETRSLMTGELSWSIDDTDPTRGGALLRCSADTLLLRQMGPGDVALRAIDVATGDVRWTTPLPNLDPRWWPTVMTFGSRLVAFAEGKKVISLDLRSGLVGTVADLPIRVHALWIGGSPYAPMIGAECARHLYAVSADSGRILWRTPIDITRLRPLGDLQFYFPRLDTMPGGYVYRDGQFIARWHPTGSDEPPISVIVDRDSTIVTTRTSVAVYDTPPWLGQECVEDGFVWL